MHVIGNHILAQEPNRRVAYMHAREFPVNVSSASRNGTTDRVEQHCRSLDALFVDGVQFSERNRQMVFACEKYPREIEGVEQRLKSRFVWGLTVEVGPPELETRVAILHRKAQRAGVNLPSDVALYIAERSGPDGRALQGALSFTLAAARLLGNKIDLAHVSEYLKRFPTPS